MPIRLTSILFTRFILSLRSIDYNSNGYDGSLPNSSINFASTIAGNIGASLDHSGFGNGSNGEASIQQQIEDPLSIGILDAPQSFEARQALSSCCLTFD